MTVEKLKDAANRMPNLSFNDEPKEKMISDECIEAMERMFNTYIETKSKRDILFTAKDMLKVFARLRSAEEALRFYSTAQFDTGYRAREYFDGVK